MEERPKVYVIDTNVILHSADALESFPDGEVVLPLIVLEELDKFKRFNDEKGRIARHVAHFLDDLRSKGSLSEGVKLDNGSVLQVFTGKTKPEEIDLTPAKADNHILYVAWHLSKNGADVCFVSKDINARVKADAIGVKARDFERHKVNFDEFYAGYTEVPMKILELEHRPAERAEELLEEAGAGKYPNEFVLAVDERNGTHYKIFRRDPGTLELRPVIVPVDGVYGIKPRNPQQVMAFDLLLDRSVSLVTLVGMAGTGKTLLALAAGLKNVLAGGLYDRLVVARPIVPMGKDLGYLPGSKEDKLEAWMSPIYDNMDYILNLRGNRKRGYSLDKLIEEDVLQLEALTYIRGRSIPKQYVIVDEAQNLTPLEVKTIISRAGEGTKVVLTGDPYQIDNPYLDASSNGLVYTADRMRDQKLHGHVMLKRSERSKLAALAAEVL